MRIPYRRMNGQKTEKENGSCGLLCTCLWCGVQYGTKRQNDIVVVRQEEDFFQADRDTTEPDNMAVVSDEASVVPTETVQEVYVHVCGAVATEGVYMLPKGSRLTDAVTAAGGFTEEADTTYHNLAAELSDGQKVYVPTLAETEALPVAEKAGKVSETGEGTPVANGKVNINTATKEELMTLRGIGEAKAESILLYRHKVGPFQIIEELKHVSGIGDAMFERIKDGIIAE